MPEVFAQSDIDFGRTDRVKHHIKLSDETPFKHRARPIHPHDLDAVRRHLQELLQAGIIRESESPFSSPIVVVRKKNGEVRLCVDYRKLNLQTVKDAYALPNLEETFSALTGSKWFTVLDLKSGYYQIEVEEADKPKTAFVCPLGFWEFNRMAQGITNAPSTFQRLMEKCVGDMNLREVVVFLDDVIVFSKTLEEHEIRLMRVLSRLKEYGLKLSPAKCRFFQTSVRYLGHIVSQSGVETDPDKVEALKTWPRPQNLKQLRSFLGFSGYYRRFIKDYSSIVKPLTDLTSGYPPLRKSFKHKAKDSQYHDPKESFGGRWTSACETAFNTIITKLTTAPVLGFADSKIPYVLHTDASTTGLGAALYQEQEEPDSKNTKDVLVLTDHFTKYAIAIPTPNQKAQTVAKCLWDNLIVQYGIPECLHSDQGPDFESHVIKELCQLMGIRKTHTTPYHPRSNPVERFNRTLLNMLGTLRDEDKSRWRNFVKPLVHAYNCTRNDVTGFTPYELMFGRQPRLPVDLAFGLPLQSDQRKSHSQYVQELKSHLEDSFKIASLNSEKNAKANKTRFDAHITASKLEAGDRVLVRAVRLRGKHKLADRWETDIHVVVKKAGDLPVYTVRPENHDGPLRTLHRDLLRPCSFLPVSVGRPVTPQRLRRPQTRQFAECNTEDVFSDFEEDFEIHRHGRLPAMTPTRFTAVYEIPRRDESNLPGDDPVNESNLPADGPVDKNDLPVVVPVEDDYLTPGTPVREKTQDQPESQSLHLTFAVDTNVAEPAEADSNANSSEPADEAEPQEMAEQSIRMYEQPEEVSNVPLEESNAVSSDDAATETLDGIRRSTRNRERPDRLQYSRLGHPLISIVQSLFQGLSTAFTDVLQDAQDSEYLLTSCPKLTTKQPPPCTGTCMISRGEGVAQTNNLVI
ncbi:uncharacterized protein LOC119262492 [Pygocentrus nattereri]|uniref:uncharacterized protein LOC119262492 n=1 Tax=Pygocentrus nattereri TaxID=42514 RepID=UPI00189119DB|nr:uncharacterized protein LOC119262492 [Pygocentrus nattereri]